MSREKADSRRNNRLTGTYKVKKSKLPLIVPIVAVLCLFLGITVYALLNKDVKEATYDDYNVVVTPENVSQLAQQMGENDYTPVGAYEVNMNSEWIFPDGDSASSNAYIGNGISNKNPVYVTVTLSGSNTEVLRSPVIPIGSHLENIKLNTKLNTGTYDAVVKYHLLNAKGEVLSHVSVSIKITIQ